MDWSGWQWALCCSRLECRACCCWKLGVCPVSYFGWSLVGCRLMLLVDGSRISCFGAISKEAIFYPSFVYCILLPQLGWGIGSIGLTEIWPVNWLNWMVDQSCDQSKISLLETLKWNFSLRDAKILWISKSSQGIQIVVLPLEYTLFECFGNSSHYKTLI